MNILAYPVDVEKDGDGLVATIPDIAEAFMDVSRTFVCCDGSVADVLAKARICLDDDLADLVKCNAEIPVPSLAFGRHTISPSVTLAAKVMLYVEMRRQCITNAELARRIGVFPQEVGRILNPDVQTKIVVLEKALAALSKRLVVGVE